MQAPELVERLGDPNLFVRWTAARSLRRIGGRPVSGEIEGLARLLCDQDLSVRMAAAAALASFGPEAAAAIPELLTAAGQGDAEPRIEMLTALAAIGREGERVVPVVAQQLAHSDPRVRRAAALTIGQFGADAALAADALRRALRDPDAEVRRYASEALLNIPVPEE